MDILKNLREKKNITQTELARAIGIAQASIGNYERGERSPDADTLIKYAKYFNCSVDYILGLTEVMKPDTTIQAIQEITGLSERAIEIFKDTDYAKTINLLVEACPNIFTLMSLYLFGECKIKDDVICNFEIQTMKMNIDIKILWYEYFLKQITRSLEHARNKHNGIENKQNP